MHMTLERPDAASPSLGANPEETLRFVQEENAYAALGRAVAMLLPYENFRGLRFGQVAPLLAGHVNRRHYGFVLDGDQPVGFIGWTFASEVAAHLWSTEGDASLFEDGLTGDCVIMNIWQASTSEANAFLRRKVRKMFSEKKALFARRYYADGRVRPVRINNPKFRRAIQ